MTFEELKEINALIARAFHHLRDYDTTALASDYRQYHELWLELKNDYGLELPAFKGKRPIRLAADPA